MRRLVRHLCNVYHRPKFAAAGKGCRFQGLFIEVDGHVELGRQVKIREYAVLRTHKKGQILIGDRTGLSYHCMVEATKMVKIGRFTGIAEFSVIRDTNHMVWGSAEHWRLTPHIAEPVVVGECCMITSQCYIGPGVAIGDGAVIAPQSFVTKDVGPLEVWGGNPARKIGHRLHGPVAESMRSRHAELLERFGVQSTPFDDELKAIREAAEAGENKAAAERDRLFNELSPEGDETSPSEDDDL